MNGTALQLEPPLLSWLEERLPAPLLERTLAGPLREFLARPGKQLRARLVGLSWALASGRGDPPADLCLAVELLHAGSLIVDDIEDCSEERRGAPTLHLAAGLPVALNAGNWLYFAALEQLGALPLDERRSLSVLRRANACLARCHEGQALDVGVRISSVAQRDVPALVLAIAERKTGGLSALCASLAATCAGASPRVEQALTAFGESLGVALQILDDTGAVRCEERRGKGEEDLRNGRATWAWSLVAQRASPSVYRPLQQLSARVEQGALPPALLVDDLRPLLSCAGSEAARQRLDQSIDSLRAVLGPSRALEETAALVHQMEASYG